MAYTAGVFYIDLVSGSDAARTALTGCIASNPSGTITRINKTAHGLVTGAVVDLTLFSAWLNGAWKITKVDNDNFDLDTAVWQTTADNDGTVTPRGGSSWADAWLTISSGASATRVQSGDEVRVSKTEDPFSIGSATWTNASKTVTLATAQTLTIDNCETAWTAANTSTVATNATSKQGANSVRVVKPGATTNTLYAYKALGSTVDFSGYNAVTLWVQAYAASNFLSNSWVLALCSDTAGATVVDSFSIPGAAAIGQWYPITLTRTGGGSLGSSIQSVALYSGFVSPSAGIGLDNISACSSSGLNLTILIGKSSSASFDINEGWWGIQSIVGTTVLLDATTNTVASAGKGYYGTGETVTTYARKTFAQGQFTSAAADINIVRTGVVYSGGWDTSTSTKNGMTVFDGVNGLGRNLGVNTALAHEFSDFWLTRFSYGSTPGATLFAKISNVGYSNCTNALFVGAGDAYTKTKFTNCIMHSNTSALTSQSAVPAKLGGPIFNNCKFYSHTSTALPATFDLQLVDCDFANNTSNDATFAQMPMAYTAIGSTFTNPITLVLGHIYTKNCLFAGATEFNAITAYTNQRIHSQQHDQTAYDYIWTDGGTMNTEATDRSGQTGNMWRLVLTNTTRTSNYPLDLPVGQFAVTANNLVTVSAWMKKSHATNCNGRLRVRAYQLAGLTSDVTATLANNTDWQELTLTFTPTEAGVFEVEALAEYVAANANVYIDTISVSQA